MVSVADSGCRATVDFPAVLFEAAPIAVAGSQYLFVDSNDRGHACEQPLAAAEEQSAPAVAVACCVAAVAVVSTSRLSQ